MMEVKKHERLGGAISRLHAYKCGKVNEYGKPKN